MLLGMQIAGTLGAVILLYTLVKGVHDALKLGEVCAVMRVVRVTLDDNKSEILKLWVPCK